RTLLAKVGKALDAKNVEIASLKAQIDNLNKHLEAYEPQSREKEKKNANDIFARIEDIIEAKEHSMKSLRR
ncbi:hypothetical protein QBC36DRAFT_142939, partial [Triangularia setosa]